MDFLASLKKNSFLRKTLALSANVLNGFPSRGMTIIGITGTTGKTTLSFFLKQILENENEKIGLIGTAGYYLKNKVIYHSGSGPATTPDPFLLFSLLKTMKKEGIRKVIMEVTSFGLMYQRVYSLSFKIGILTNISYSHHIKIHGNFENYLHSKLQLFQLVSPSGLSILPKDSQYFELFKKNSRAKVISYGFDEQSDYYAKILREEENGIEFEVYKKGEGKILKMKLNIPFRANVLNALVGIIVSDYFGLDREKTKEKIENLKTIPGRLEIIEFKGRKILVDKANTEIAFQEIIQLINLYKPKKKIAVYGNFGSSSFQEREKLAKLALDFFDLTIITEDDPLDEPRDKGINDFIDYAQKNQIDQKKYLAILDRRNAIEEALKRSRPGDFVAILGRGNEKWLLYNKEKIPFDDREVVQELLNSIKLE